MGNILEYRRILFGTVLIIEHIKYKYVGNYMERYVAYYIWGCDIWDIVHPRKRVSFPQLQPFPLRLLQPSCFFQIRRTGHTKWPMKSDPHHHDIVFFYGLFDGKEL